MYYLEIILGTNNIMKSIKDACAIDNTTMLNDIKFNTVYNINRILFRSCCYFLAIYGNRSLHEQVGTDLNCSGNSHS